MEGAYFYGEHLRWNLGWENPNPAGAFVAMGLPWLWAAALAAVRGGEWRWRIAGVAAFLCEAALWFLLCKTYSRGALVAAFVAGAVFLALAWYRDGWRGATRLAWPRGVVVVVLLVATGFFARIDPGYVAGDASATNRLSLWKGGLQMIAVSPWQGWGVGESGSGFMHWFQGLEASEGYAGMVNSYLHVAVERGLPVLGAVLAVAGALLGLAWLAIRGGRRSSVGGRVSGLLLGAACSLLVFLVANVFSTLWIFGDLWWLALAAAAGIVAGGLWCLRGGRRRAVATSAAAGALLAAAGTSSLWLAGRSLSAETSIRLRGDGAVVCQAAGGSGLNQVVLLADSTVLGETWGKEVRRLAVSRPSWSIVVPSDRVGDGDEMSVLGGQVIACGAAADDGLAHLTRADPPELTLVHPLGKPGGKGVAGKEVRVIIPELDTSGSGRRWRSFARRHGWKCWKSEGVGQDVRLQWPQILDAAMPTRGDGQ